MLLTLLASAAPEAHAAAAESGLLQQFGVEGYKLLWQLVSFSILAFTLYRFAIRPVLATLEERNRKISEGLQFRDDMEARLAQARGDAEQALKQAAIDAQKVVQEARAQAKEFAERSQKEAQEQASQILDKAREALDLERQKILNETRGKVTRLVVATAEKVLRTQLSDSDRQRFNQAAARELAGS